MTLTIPQGSYRFRTTTHNLSYYSGSDDHCATPTCTTATISVPQFSDVTVTVADTAGAFAEGAVVTAFTSDNGSEVSTGVTATTGANGQAVLTLPTGSYLFKATVHTILYASGTTYDCTTPTCTTAVIQTAKFGDVTVTVSDANHATQAGVTVIALNGDTVTSFQAVTGDNGAAVLTLPEGGYRFRAVAHGLSFESAETNHCTVTTCTSATISIPVIAPVTVTVLNRGSVPQANLPVVAYRVVEVAQPTATPTAEPSETPTTEPTETPTPQPEENIMALTELVETGIQGTTDANGQVTLYLPADTYRFRTDIYGHQYFSDEAVPVVVPTNNTASITVPVFGAVTVTVADSDHEPVPDLAVYAYLGQDEYVGISGTTGEFGRVTLMLPEGTYRFKTEQYGIEFWSSQNANCNTPSECTTASITVIGRDYLANDQTINYTYDDLS